MSAHTFTCDRCLTEYFGSKADVFGEGWKRHAQGKAEILLCEECETEMQRIWTIRKRLAV